MNEIDKHMDHAGRQLQAMLAAALAIAQAVAERRDRAVRDAARAAGVDAQEAERQTRVERLTQAVGVPTPAEVAGRGPLSGHPATSTREVVDGLRQTDPGEVAKVWAAHTTLGPGDQPDWDHAVRALGADPDQARADATRIKAEVVDPAVVSRDAAHRIGDLTAATVVMSGDHTADRTTNDDRAAVLEALHGPEWADTTAAAGHGEKPASDQSKAADSKAEQAVGAWQHGAEAPRPAGMA